MLTEVCFLALLGAAAWTDFTKRRIPDGLAAGIGLVGLIALCTASGPGVAAGIGGAFAVSLPLFLIVCIRPGAFGGGDIKLMAAGGLFLGTRMVLLSFALALLGSGIYSAFLLLKGGGRGKQFALGPFLCAAMAIVSLWGEQIWRLGTGAA